MIGLLTVSSLIFSITVDAMPERNNELSGLMVTAIVGGALIPPITGAVADIAVHLGFIVPAACILYILIISLKHSNK